MMLCLYSPPLSRDGQMIDVVFIFCIYVDFFVLYSFVLIFSRLEYISGCIQHFYSDFAVGNSRGTTVFINV
jgi:hypothetical protein